MTDVTVEKTELDEYFDRVKAQSALTALIVNWHTDLHSAIKEDELLPYTVDQTYINVSVFDPKLDDEGNVVKWQQGDLNVDKTLAILAKVVKYARSRGFEVKKNYESSDFTVEVILDSENTWKSTVKYYCKRDAVCTAVVVGKKTIPAKPATPPEVVDVIEWQCEKISLLGYDE